MRLRHAVGQRDHHQRPVPEVLVLVVLNEPRPAVAGLADVDARQTSLGQLADQEVQAHLLRLGRLQEFAHFAARHLDDTDDACRDLCHAHAARIAGGQEDLDGLGAGHARLNGKKDAISLFASVDCASARLAHMT